MAEKHNLGRGLGDLIGEVSNVRAVPAQPMAEVGRPPEPSAAVPAEVPPETPLAPPPPVAGSETAPLAEQETPVLIEERPADVEIEQQHANQPPPPPPEAPVREVVVRRPYVPLWMKVAVGLLVCIVAGLVMTLVQLQGFVKGRDAELKTARAALMADPLAWTDQIQCAGVRVERSGHGARLLFEAPFFLGGTQWAPRSEEVLKNLLVQLAPHAGGCHLTVVGHTGTQALPPGSPYKDNLELGLRRAETVLDAMVRVVKWPLSGVAARSSGDKYQPHRGDDLLSQIRNRTITIEIRPQE